jgi:hypothetical protein
VDEDLPSSDGDTIILSQDDEVLMNLKLTKFTSAMEELLVNENFWTDEEYDLKTSKFNQEVADYYYSEYEIAYSKRLNAPEYRYICVKLLEKYPNLRADVNKVVDERNKDFLLGKSEKRKQAYQEWVRIF